MSKFGKTDPPELQEAWDLYKHLEWEYTVGSGVLAQKGCALGMAYKSLEKLSEKVCHGSFSVDSMNYYFGHDGLQGHSK